MIPLKDDAPRIGTPFINYTLLLLNIVAFFFEISLNSAARQQVVFAFGVVPARFTVVFFNHGYVPWNLISDLGTRYVPAAGAIVPVFTSMFLHGSWLHLIFNMWALWIFGDNVEDYLGHTLYLFFYLICGVAAALLHALFNIGSTVPSVGASGAIAGVMGAYLILFPRARVLTLVLFCLVLYKWLPDWIVFAFALIGIAMCILFAVKPQASLLKFLRIFLFFFLWLPAWIVLGYWFIAQFLSGAASSIAQHGSNSSGIAFWAHVGGFIAGVVLVKLFPVRTRRYHYGM